MFRSFPFLLIASPAAAHSLPNAHLHSDNGLLLAGGLAVIVTAAGLAMIGARK